MAEAARGEVCPTGAQLSALLDGELGDAERGRVREHVRGCQGCAAELGGLARVRNQLRSVPPREVPAELWQGAVARARDAGSRSRRRGAERRALAALLVAAAVTSALAVGFGADEERSATRPFEGLVGGVGTGDAEGDGALARPLLYDQSE